MNRFWRCLLLGVLSLTACGGHTGSYTWVQELPANVTAPGAYIIGPGDLLDIRVYNEPSISGRARVRGDGMVTVSLIGDVQARGKTPGKLAEEVQLRLQKFLQAPSVAIAIEESHPLTVTVMGEVGKAGVFTLSPNSGVLQALASAGGLSEYADSEHIYVVRRNPNIRVRFTYEALVENSGGAADFMLKDGDLVTVE